jgi:hypothetical protein
MIMDDGAMVVLSTFLGNVDSHYLGCVNRVNSQALAAVVVAGFKEA